MSLPALQIPMADAGDSASPLATVAESIGEPTTNAFSLLGNETRLAILLALWEAYEPFAEGTWDPREGNTVSFSDLRNRVGIRQGSQFNYHLDKLVGEFVSKTEDGYQLTPAGNKIVRTVIAVSGFEDTSLPPSEIDVACVRCGAAAEITYQDQRLYYLCTNCEGNFTLGDEHPSNVLGAEITNPRALSNRTPEAIYDAVRTEKFHDTAKEIAGVCHICTGPIDETLVVCDEHTPSDDGPCPTCGRRTQSYVQMSCPVCKHGSQLSVVTFTLRQPAVISFCWEHDRLLGTDSHDTARITRDLVENAHEDVVSLNPPRVRVTIRYQGDDLLLAVDEDLSVTDVTDNHVTERS